MQFQTNMREVLFFIKYSKDKQKMSELLEKNKARFQAMERRAADVIQAVTNAGLKYNRRKERIDMCQELQEMREMLQKVRAEVEAEQKARIEEGKEIARTMFQSGLGVEIIARYVKQDVAVIQAWVEE